MSSALFLVWAFYFLETFTKIEARYCSYEIGNDLKYYICQRNEYCCSYGCCLSPTFQFYQLWYYWLMVIFMFLLCSGGQWWYRYWLQGRYSGELVGSSGVRGGSSHLPHHTTRRPGRVAYHPARDQVILHNIWKPNYPGSSRNSPPPSYSTNASGRSGVDMEAASRELLEIEQRAGVVVPPPPKPSPYFQLYGPPPTYDQVIRESRAGGCGGGEPHSSSTATAVTVVPIPVAPVVPSVPPPVVQSVPPAVVPSPITLPPVSQQSPASAPPPLEQNK